MLDDRPATDLDHLADEITAHEAVDADRQAVKVSLHHVHVPLLQDVGAIEYDPVAQRITPVPRVLDEVADVSRTTASRDGRSEALP